MEATPKHYNPASTLFSHSPRNVWPEITFALNFCEEPIGEGLPAFLVILLTVTGLSGIPLGYVSAQKNFDNNA